MLYPPFKKLIDSEKQRICLCIYGLSSQKQHRFLEIAFYVLLTVFAFTLSKYAHLLLERLQDVEKVALYA